MFIPVVFFCTTLTMEARTFDFRNACPVTALNSKWIPGEGHPVYFAGGDCNSMSDTDHRSKGCRLDVGLLGPISFSCCRTDDDDIHMPRCQQPAGGKKTCATTQSATNLCDGNKGLRPRPHGIGAYYVCPDNTCTEALCCEKDPLELPLCQSTSGGGKREPEECYCGTATEPRDATSNEFGVCQRHQLCGGAAGGHGYGCTMGDAEEYWTLFANDYDAGDDVEEAGEGNRSTSVVGTPTIAMLMISSIHIL